METWAGPGSRDQKAAYLLLRLIAGMDFFGHGFARIFTGAHLGGFAHSMAGDMAKSPLPAPLVLAAGYVVPCTELLIGVLLLAGLATRYALILAMLLMVVLMFGITMKQEWKYRAAAIAVWAGAGGAFVRLRADERGLAGAVARAISGIEHFS